MNLLLAAATSGLLILSYPPLDLGWLAWGALVPWLALLKRVSAKKALLYSFLVGLLFSAGTVGWLIHVALLAALLVVPILALYFALFGFLVRLLQKSAIGNRQSAILFGLPSLWVLMEFTRSHFPLSGFGGNLLAHTQWNWFQLIQVADCTGVYGVSFLVVMVNVALWQFIRTRRLEWASAVTFLCLVAALLYGTFRMNQMDGSLSPNPSHLSPAFRIALVQGNIPQTQKWEEGFQEGIWDRYESLTLAASKRKPDLIAWPETAVPTLLGEPGTTDRLSRLAWSVRTPLLVGVAAYTEDPAPRMSNSAIFLDAEGNVRQRYDKTRLVPFGEYIPFRRLFEWLYHFFPIGDFSPGEEYVVFEGMQDPLDLRPSTFHLPPFSVLICFEDLFPYLSRRFLLNGAELLFVLTNDAWFKESAESIQHLQASVFRAVEGRVWVVRATNTGWSGFVDPAGRRLPAPHQIPRFEPGVTVADLRVAPIGSFYTRVGGWFELLCLGIAGLSFLRSRTPI